MLITLGLAAVSAGVLVAVPFLVLAAVLGARRFPTVMAAVLAVMVTLGATARGGMWYLERGWAVILAGGFVFLTMRWPGSRFFPRALGAVGGAFALVAVLLAVQPGSWAMVDWLVTEGIMKSVSLAMSLVAAWQPEVDIPTEMVHTAFETAALQGKLFPALLGLSSLAGLGVAWWGYVRLATGSDQGLGPLKDFRFNDHFVWLLLAGLTLIVLGLSDAWTRVGTNAVVFMGGLYAIRGVAVVLFLNGGISLFGFLVMALGMLVLAPVLTMGALVIGVGDTWLDLRARAEAMPGSTTDT
jgi:hypothetical protein